MHVNKPHFVVIIAPCPFPYGSASDNAIYTFTAGFNEQGCEGEVVCLYPNLPSFIDCPPKGTYKGVNYVFLHKKIHRSKSRIRNRIDVSLTSFLLKQYLKEKIKKYQVTALFVTHINKSYFKQSKLCHSLGIETVLFSCEYPELLIDSSPVRIEFFRHYSSHTDKYIFETKTLEDYTRSFLQNEIDSYVNPAMMPFEDILQAQRTETAPYIAYCGSIHSDDKDGLTNIIRAYSTVCKKFPGVELKFIGMIGNQEYFDQLKMLVDELGLQKQISFICEVSREDYVKYLTNALLLIVAKPRNSYYGGGLSSKVVEYLFSGNPVLMTRSDDYVYYLTHGENVFFIQDNEPKTLSVALCEMLGHPDIMRLIGNGGKKFALEHFNYHILSKGLLQFILKS